MRFLLDTSVFLWMAVAPDRLGALREPIADPGNERVVSVATPWEIAIKTATGRLVIPGDLNAWIGDHLRRSSCRLLPVELEHVLGVARLPPVHRDPFDRLLIATARALDVPILTSDSVFAGYDVEVVSP